MQWWLLISVPAAFILLCARALENYFEDLANYRSGSELISQSVIGGE